MQSFAEAAKRSREAAAPVRDLVRSREAVGGQDDVVAIMKTISAYYLFRQGATPAKEDGVSTSNQVIEPPDPNVYVDCRLKYHECRFPLEGLLGAGLRRRNEIGYMIASAIHGFLEDCRQFGNDEAAGPPTWVLVAAEISTVHGKTLTVRPPTAEDVRSFKVDQDQVPLGAWSELPAEKRAEILGLHGVEVVVDSDNPEFILRLVAADIYSRGPCRFEVGASGGWALAHRRRHRDPAQALIARSYGVADVARASLSPAVIERALKLVAASIPRHVVQQVCQLSDEQYESIVAQPDLDPETKQLVLRLREAGEDIDVAVAATGASKTVIGRIWHEADTQPSKTKKEK